MPVRIAGITANVITDTDLERLAKNKLEARFVYDGVSGSQGLIRPYLSTQYGYANFSANDSPTTVRSFPMPETLGNVVMAKAEVMNHRLKATVTDVTGTSVQITVGPWNFTGTTVDTFSSITTASVRTYWEIVSTPQP